MTSDPFILDAVTHCNLEYLRHSVAPPDYTIPSLKLRQRGAEIPFEGDSKVITV